jgi:hypothetical protein
MFVFWLFCHMLMITSASYLVSKSFVDVDCSLLTEAVYHVLNTCYQSGNSYYFITAVSTSTNITATVYTFASDDPTCTGTIDIESTSVYSSPTECTLTSNADEINDDHGFLVDYYMLAEIVTDLSSIDSLGPGQVSLIYGDQESCTSPGTAAIRLNGYCVPRGDYMVIDECTANLLTTYNYNTSNCDGLPENEYSTSPYTCANNGEFTNDDFIYPQYSSQYCSTGAAGSGMPSQPPSPSPSSSAAPVSEPSTNPTYAPTATPTFQPGSTVVVFDVAIVLENVNSTAFMTDASAQLSFRTATAESMPGVFADDITILSVEAEVSPAVSTGHALLSRARQRALQITTQRSRVHSNVQVTPTQLSGFCNDCTNAQNSYDYLTVSLNTSVATGAYTASLQAASAANGASATANAVVSQPPVDSGYSSYIATTNPTAQPSAAAASAAAAPSGVVGGAVGGTLAFVLVASAAAYYLCIHSKGKRITCYNGRVVITDGGSAVGTTVEAGTVNPMSSLDSGVDKKTSSLPVAVELSSPGATAVTADETVKDV